MVELRDAALSAEICTKEDAEALAASVYTKEEVDAVLAPAAHVAGSTDAGVKYGPGTEAEGTPEQPAVALGAQCEASAGSLAVGASAAAGGAGSVAIGRGARVSGDGSVQILSGTGAGAELSASNVLRFKDTVLVAANGKIPASAIDIMDVINAVKNSTELRNAVWAAALGG